jgi:hypothetical protein
MIRHAAAFTLLISTGTLIAQHVPVIEDTIAGITVGKSTLGDLQQKFGRRLIVDKEFGSYSVRIDGQCELFFNFGIDTPNPDQKNSRVMNIQLMNLGKGGEQGSRCNEFSTGRGLRLSDSFQRVLNIYGKPMGQLTIGEYEANGYDNIKSLCTSSSSPNRSVVVRDFGFDWSPKDKSIHSINMGVTSTTCGDLNDRE